jgi:insulysin
LAGLQYNFANQPNGVMVTLSGYNDKMSVLAKAVLEKAKTLKVEEEKLSVIKEEVERSLKNFFMGDSYHQSDFNVRHLLTDKSWTMEEKLKELKCMLFLRSIVAYDAYLNGFHSHHVPRGSAICRETLVRG